jgi:GGDEF domain-containing protein
VHDPRMRDGASPAKWVGVYPNLGMARPRQMAILRNMHQTRTGADALVDSLTGFGTRHALVAALDDAMRAQEATLLVIFSLDGFDEYSALFGQLAARTLLVKLAARLTEALGPGGRCFRPRRDEFAALVETRIDGAASVLDSAVAALRERAAPVAVAASWGAAMLPDEAGDSVGALALADERLASNAPRRRRRNRRSSSRVS